MIPLTPHVTPHECGECQLCCKLMGVHALGKLDGVWCQHVGPPGRGCSIYETRPEECRTFVCVWLSTEFSPLELRPDKIHGMMTPSLDGKHLVLYEDTDFPGAAHEALKSLLLKWIEDGTRYYVVVCGTARTFYGNTDLYSEAAAMMNELLDGPHPNH